MIDMNQVQVPGRLIGPNHELLVTMTAGNLLSSDARLIVANALLVCLTEIVENKDFDSARYVLALIEQVELNKG